LATILASFHSLRTGAVFLIVPLITAVVEFRLGRLQRLLVVFGMCVPTLLLVASRELGASRLFAVTLVALYATVLLAARPTLAVQPATLAGPPAANRPSA